MCGIFAYRGVSNATKIVFCGLQDLQYRGYDSWGIASLTDHGLDTVKDVGALPTDLSAYIDSNLAIGHTRWATHGGVTKNNAHPDLSCDGRFAVVHNGIIENFESLKNNLKNKHIFKSSTDTEFIVHYLEENTKDCDPFTIFEALMSKLIGHSAIVVLDRVQSDLYIYRSGSPLVLGKRGDERYVSSDLPSLTKYARYIYPIKDGEIIKLSMLLPALSWTKVAANKEIENKIKTKYHMESEINESLSLVSSLSHFGKSKLDLVSEAIYASKQILLVGCGSSYHACLYGENLFQKLGLPVHAVIASEGDSIQYTAGPETLVIALSQSGETIDTLDFVNILRRRGAKIVSLSNVQYSTLDRLADLSLNLGCGKEVAVASTKAYIAMLLFFVELAFCMGGKSDEDRLKYQNALKQLLSTEGKKLSQSVARRIAKLDHFYIVSRGDLVSIAQEAALKFKEIGYLHAEAIVSGEFKHGPLALISQNTTILVIKIVSDPAIKHTIAEIKARGGKLIVLDVPDLGLYAPLYAATFVHLISFYHSVIKGNNPDMPRNLAKSVTVK